MLEREGRGEEMTENSFPKTDSKMTLTDKVGASDCELREIFDGIKADSFERKTKVGMSDCELDVCSEKSSKQIYSRKKLKKKKKVSQSVLPKLQQI